MAVGHPAAPDLAVAPGDAVAEVPDDGEAMVVDPGAADVDDGDRAAAAAADDASHRVFRAAAEGQVWEALLPLVTVVGCDYLHDREDHHRVHPAPAQPPVIPSWAAGTDAAVEGIASVVVVHRPHDSASGAAPDIRHPSHLLLPVAAAASRGEVAPSDHTLPGIDAGASNRLAHVVNTAAAVVVVVAGRETSAVDQHQDREACPDHHRARVPSCTARACAVDGVVAAGSHLARPSRCCYPLPLPVTSVVTMPMTMVVLLAKLTTPVSAARPKVDGSAKRRVRDAPAVLRPSAIGYYALDCCCCWRCCCCYYYCSDSVLVSDCSRAVEASEHFAGLKKHINTGTRKTRYKYLC